MAIQRKKHWAEQDFHDFLVSRIGVPFEWAKNDCALFAADAIEAITGTDIAAEFRGSYSDEAGAWASIAKVCGGTTVADAAAYCAEKAGLVEREHPLMAQRGDLVVIEDAGRQIAGVVHLSGQLVSVGDRGIKLLPITAARRAWRY